MNGSIRQHSCLIAFTLAVGLLCASAATGALDLPNTTGNLTVDTLEAQQGVCFTDRAMYLSSSANWELSKYWINTDPTTLVSRSDVHPSPSTYVGYDDTTAKWEHIGGITASPWWVCATVDTFGGAANDPDDRYVGLQLYDYGFEYFELESFLYYNSSTDTNPMQWFGGVDWHPHGGNGGCNEYGYLFAVEYDTDEDETSIYRYEITGQDMDASGDRRYVTLVKDNVYKVHTKAVNGIEIYGDKMYLSHGEGLGCYPQTTWVNEGYIDVYNLSSFSEEDAPTTLRHPAASDLSYDSCPHAEDLSFFRGGLWVCHSGNVRRLDVANLPLPRAKWIGRTSGDWMGSQWNWDAWPSYRTAVYIYDAGWGADVTLDEPESIGALYLGTGSLTITPNGKLKTYEEACIGRWAGSPVSEATVRGPSGSSVWSWETKKGLYVGDAGHGKLTIEDAGDVIAGWVYVGKEEGSIGEIILTDWSWLAVENSMGVGKAGTGTVTIRSGGWLYSGWAAPNVAYLGGEKTGNGTVTVDGTGSPPRLTWWKINDDLRVGLLGTGKLEVLGGGRVTAGYTSIAHELGSSGEVTVDGTETELEAGWLNVGRYGTGTMTVSGGGKVSATTVNVGAYAGPGASGTLTVADGSFVCERLYIGGYPSGSEGTGTVTVKDSALLVVSGGVTIYGAGTLTGGGGSVDADVLNGGTVAPGSSPGLLLIQGHYTQTQDGVLEIELCGRLRGDEYDVLVITGRADLAGTLSVVLCDPGSGIFAPQFGDTFDILDHGGLAPYSRFDLVQLPELGLGLEWDYPYLLTTGQISVVPEPATLGLLALGGLAMILRRRR